MRRSFGATSDGNPLGSSRVISRFIPLCRMESRTRNTNIVAGMKRQVTRYGLHCWVMRDLETNALMSP